MSEEPELTPKQTEELLLNTTQALYRALGDMLELSARVDGLEVLLASLGNHAGIDPDELVTRLRTTQATAYQKRLEIVEDKSPTIAAMIADRTGMPPIDETLLKQMEIGSWLPPRDEENNG